MNEQTRQQLNAERLLLIDSSIRERVAAVIQELELEGEKPLIAKDVFRSPQRQIELFKQGRSKVRWSFHNATTPDGKPAALAADIVDATLAWNAPRTFWLRLGGAAKRHGLHWGGYFDLSLSQRVALEIALERRDYSTKLPVGWDPAHVEVKGVSLAEAKAGKRPAIS